MRRPVSVLTGLRQGEALALQWTDIDVKAGVIRVRPAARPQRGGRGAEDAAKRVSIPPSLGRMLAAHKAKAFERGQTKPNSFVFSSRADSPLAVRNIVGVGLKDLSRLRRTDLRTIHRGKSPAGLEVTDTAQTLAALEAQRSRAPDAVSEQLSA
jgi:integrase